MKVFLVLLSIFLNVESFAQRTTKYYPDGQMQSEGKYKYYKKKITYGYNVIKLKTGVWNNYYQNGEIALIENYKVRRKSNKPIGVWEYYSTNGELLKKEYYTNGKLDSQEYFNIGTYNFTSDSFKIEPIATDTLLVTNYLKGNSFGELVTNNGNGVYIYFDKVLIAVEEPETVIRLIDTSGFMIDTAINLVVNNSFERSKYFNTSGDYQINNMADTAVQGWHIAAGTPDYFRNTTLARTGENYCGIRVYSTTEYLEYLENNLKKPLKAGRKYCCKVFFKLNYKSDLATDAIGFKFNRQLLKFHYNSNHLPIPDIINKPHQMLMETKEWMQLTGLYRANGGEQYLVIGGFKAMGAANKTIVAYHRKDEAYYFIDDVYVWEVANDSDCLCNTYTVPDSLKNDPQQPVTQVKNDTTYEVGKTFIIRNIFFDVDKAELLPKSFVALDSLVEVLYQYPTMEIEISGHTDNTGTEERNTELSLQRAQAVVNYLQEFGIGENRLSYAGYAAQQPIDTNNTPQGRQNNRRVQFKILKK